MPSATSDSTHHRVRQPSVPLDSALITSAVDSSGDGGKSLNFSLKHIGDVSEEAALELSRVGAKDSDDEGVVTRLALSNNHLRKLPPNLDSLYRLRYLNLRANAFVSFPDVVTRMPLLEILDIGRNKIESLPVEPGMLVNLRVFSMSKNRISRLPSYIANFSNMRMLKVDNNPIEWPPPSVVKDKAPSGDMDEEMLEFISQLKEWYLVNSPPEQRGSPEKAQANGADRIANRQANNNTSSYTQASSSRAAHGRNMSGDSVNSEYSATSEYSLVDNVNYATGKTPGLQITKKPSRGRSDSMDRFIPAAPDDGLPAGVPSGHHGRNASYSASSRRVGPSGTILAGKQSLPDLRKGYMHTGMIKPALKKTREPLNGSFAPGASPSPTPFPATARSEISPTSAVMSDELPLDGVRNSYFRRLSAVPLPVSAPPLPPSLCQTVDAIRGILFAVSQIYSAIQQYTNAIVERRIASILVRVLEPAKRAMDTLISSLEQYDATSRRAVPSARECRSVVEACRENVSMCCRVVSVLQLQLKVLAAGAGGDVRFARHLLLMLYGGVAEVVNSWRDLMPHLAEVKEYLSGARVSPLSNGRADMFSKSHVSGLGLSMVSGSGPSSSRRPISPIEEHTEPINTNMDHEQEPEPELAHSPARSGTSHSRGAYGQKGSSGSRELKLNTAFGLASKALSSSPMDSPLSIGSDIPPAHTSPVPRRSALKNASHGVNSTGLHADLPTTTSPSHSVSYSTRSQSRDERFPSDATSSPIMRSNRIGTRRLPATLLEAADSLHAVDEDLLRIAEKAADIASDMWTLLGTTIENARQRTNTEPSIITLVENGRALASEATEKLKATLHTMREGAGKDGGKKQMYESATAFAKCITRTIIILKKFSDSYTISPKLRTLAGRLTQATQEMIFFLQGSSFAPPPSARPTSPAFAIGLGFGFGGAGSNLNPDAADGHSRTGSALGRNWDAAAGARAVPIPGTPRRVPLSAVPGQSFRTAEHPYVGRTGAQLI